MEQVQSSLLQTIIEHMKTGASVNQAQAEELWGINHRISRHMSHMKHELNIPMHRDEHKNYWIDKEWLAEQEAV
ncbi:hypothetical protein [Psychrobacter sp. I-STPA6b]|uniref:hypothetical protein n=1 Tax=Psychrobacter sp. I-STPA6b TaxID=2585718 RepID=UPI001D0CC7E0|nr:hypothetical protein [Psychrobacter sp. I-STPA6b]